MLSSADLSLMVTLEYSQDVLFKIVASSTVHVKISFRSYFLKNVDSRYVEDMFLSSLRSQIVLAKNLPKGEIVGGLHVGCTFAKTMILDTMFQHLGAISVHLDYLCCKLRAPYLF